MPNYEEAIETLNELIQEIKELKDQFAKETALYQPGDDGDDERVVRHTEKVAERWPTGLHPNRINLFLFPR